MSDEISLARGWTLEAYVAHNEAMRVKDAEIMAAVDRFHTERDRRYSEVATEREKALAIKERADTDARILVAENQAYRDEKGNELRAQIERERGTYTTRAEFKPVSDYVTSQIGAPRSLTTGSVVSIVAAVSILAGIYFGFQNVGSKDTPAKTPVVTCSATYHPTPCPTP